MRATLIVLLLLTACVTTGPPATDAERTQATKELIACYRKAAVELDDGISGAATIARVITSRCYRVTEQYNAVATKGANRRVAAMVKKGLLQSQQDLATEVVLKLRSK